MKLNQILENSGDDYTISKDDQQWTSRKVCSAIRGAVLGNADQETARRIDYILLPLGREKLIDLYNEVAGFSQEEIKKRLSKVWSVNATKV